MTRVPLIAANWKMNGRLDWATRPREFASLADEREGVEVLICPPAPYLAPMAGPCALAGIALGAQTCSAHTDGPHTGEVSARMLRDVGCDYVIVGHSERRAAGATSAQVSARAEAAQWADLTPIVCVGEMLDVREAGNAVSTVLSQLEASLPTSNGDKRADVVVAYEPVWAIGTGRVATPADIAEMHAAIRNVVGDEVRVLYGGSVKPANAVDVLATDNVDGALVGGAGLQMDSLAAIVRTASDVMRG